MGLPVHKRLKLSYNAEINMCIQAVAYSLDSQYLSKVFGKILLEVFSTVTFINFLPPVLEQNIIMSISLRSLYLWVYKANELAVRLNLVKSNPYC